MSSSTPHLQQALMSLPEPADLPMALPTTHLSIARWFSAIADEGQLQPRACKVFKKDLLYFFYGGVFYRPSERPTKNAAELPVAFLFEPTVLKEFDCYYPFDTGAMAAGLFGDWKERLEPFEERFKVAGNWHPSVTSLMIHHLYGSNENYLSGHVDPSLSLKSEPLPQLHEFFSDDLTSRGVDGRQLKIECQTCKSLPLDRELIWVGYPESMSDIYARIYERTKPYAPEPYLYPDHVLFVPNEIAAQLQIKAEEVMKRRYVRLPRPKGGL